MFAQTSQRNWDTWITYFEHNAMSLLAVDWDEKYQLSWEEHLRITQSVQQFQLGESSEGKHVIEQAQRYIAASGDDKYLPALRLFIKEEQRHARYLARFMQKQDIPLAHSDPVDGVFRLLRRAFNLELSIMAMLTAEIIAVPYYKSLYDATDSPLLKQICRQLLRDEMQHLQFQLDALEKIDERHSSLVAPIMHMLHRILFAGAVLIVWQQHRLVLKSSRHSFPEFWRENWQHFNNLCAKREMLNQEITP